MKNINKTPRILRINSVDGYIISCVFNNGESRVINFKLLFDKWKIKKNDPEYLLLNPHEFKKVVLRNQNLSWKNIKLRLKNIDGDEVIQPYEISPDVLYKISKPSKESEHRFYFGATIRKFRIKQGMTQEELAKLSGTSKTYISRIENDQIEPELTTLYKIVEIGLGKQIKVQIK